MKSVAKVAVALFFMAGAFGQVISVSTNAKVVVPSADSYLSGGKIVLTFNEPYTPSTPHVISFGILTPLVKFDTDRAPAAYRDSYSRNELTSGWTGNRQFNVTVDSAPYSTEFKTIHVEGFVLDVLGSGLVAGDKVMIQIVSQDDQFTFSNPEVILVRVGSAKVR